MQSIIVLDLVMVFDCKVWLSCPYQGDSALLRMRVHLFAALNKQYADTKVTHTCNGTTTV
jgi:hypothetical protein